MGETVLVTGCAGFIALHTIMQLNKDGFQIIGVDRKQKPANFLGKYYQIDITSPEIVRIFKENSIDYVIHLAALPSVSESIKNPQADCMDNYYATVNICYFSKLYGVKKIIFSSTAAVYAKPRYLPVDEEHPIDFISPYAITKGASENFIKYSGIDYIIFRYSNVYGYGQDSNGEAGVVAKFFDQMSHNKNIKIYGTGEQTRDFISVVDVAAVNVLALKCNVKNEIINVSTNRKTSIKELYWVIKQVLNYNKEPIYTFARPGDIEHSILDNTKLLNLLNYTPFVLLKDGILDMKDKNDILGGLVG